MESAHIPQDNTLINFMLTTITGTLGFISVNFSESLKQVDFMLSPIVKLCSLLSFILFLIINYDTLRLKIKKFFNFKKK